MASSELSFFELLAPDLARAKHFYGEIFGWTFQQASPEFITIQGASVAGGILKDETPAAKGRPNSKIFFQVDSLGDKLALVQKLGGKITIQPMQLGPSSWLAEFTDPDGNTIGLLSKNPPAQR